MSRPKTVPVVAAFLFAATAIAVVTGVSLLFPNLLLHRLWDLNRPAAAAFQAAGRIAGAPLVALGVGTAAAGNGLLRRRKWAWWFAVALFSVNGCGDAASFWITHDLVRSASGIAISAAFLCFLIRPGVRRYFANR